MKASRIAHEKKNGRVDDPPLLPEKKKIQFFVPTVKSCSAMPTHVSTIVRLERRRVHARNAPYIVTNPSCANECDR